MITKTHSENSQPRFDWKYLLASSCTAAMLAQGADPASAITFLNQNFNTTNQGFNLTSGITDFTVTGGNVDVIGTNSFDFYPGNGNYIDLNGNTSGTLTSSTFNFNPGDNITLSFDYGANASGTANVSFLGQTFNLSAIQGPNFNTFTQTFNITSATSSALIFASTNPGFGGIVIDNVKIDSTAVPEPSEILGTVAAFGSVLLLKRKLSKKK